MRLATTVAVGLGLSLVVGVVVYAYIERRDRKRWPDPKRRYGRRWRANRAAYSRMRVAAYALAAILLLGGVLLEQWHYRLGKLTTATGMLTLLLAFVQGKRNRRRFARHLIECSYRVCSSCTYRLEGLPDKGRCPECGEDYSLDSLESDWKESLEA